MPPVSQAQRRWAYAAAAGKVPGVPKSVGKKFEGKGIKGLPEKAVKPRKSRAKKHVEDSRIADAMSSGTTMGAK